jgi:serine phosphatase RsbU (regulator of sigma subunit)
MSVRTVAAAVRSLSRLAAVHSTGLLDTPADPDFDRLAGLAANLLDAPYAFVTLVDDTRSFWKSCIGTDSDDLAQRQNPVEESFCQYVVETREPLIVGDTRADAVTAGNPSIESMGVLAWAGFPVFAPDGEVLGSFCVVDTTTREWSDRDVEVLDVLSKAVASEFALRISLQAARAAERAAHALAVTLQDSLLPPVPPSVGGLEVAARYRPAGHGQHVVGDFYDVFQLSGRSRWAITMGDVSGKGVEAAKVTALARHTIRAAGMLGGSPADVLQALNAAMLAHSSGSVDAEPRFLTVTYAQLRLAATGGVDVRLSSAGHCPSLIRRTSGQIESVELPSFPLGWFDELDLTEHRTRLDAGDTVILHTDGVTEARCGSSQFGESRLIETVRSAPGAADAATIASLIEDAVRDYAGESADDDVAILVVRVPPAS